MISLNRLPKHYFRIIPKERESFLQVMSAEGEGKQATAEQQEQKLSCRRLREAQQAAHPTQRERETQDGL